MSLQGKKFGQLQGKKQLMSASRGQQIADQGNMPIAVTVPG